MRKILFLLAFVFIGFNAFSQENENLYDQKFNIGLDVYNNIWSDLPENISQKGLNLGYSIYGMYNHQLGDSKFSVAFGGGISSFVFASNGIIEDIKADVIELKPIDKDIKYERSKINFSYIDFPIEMRFKTANKIRFAIGGKIGFKLDNHTSYDGQRFDGSGISEKVKKKKINNVEGIFVGSTVRIGYKWLNLNFNYALTNVFESEKGPKMKPFSVGITFMPF